MRQACNSGRTLKAAFILLVTVQVFGCASNVPAPVVERDHSVPVEARSAAVLPKLSTSELYTVKKGDTLYSISLDHGQSYRDIAVWNNLEDPNRIQIGQQLRVIPPGKEGEAPVAVARPVSVAATPIETIESAPRAAATKVAPATGVVDTLKREPKGGKQAYSAEALAKMQKPEPVPGPVPLPSIESKPETSKVVTQEKPVPQPVEKPVPALAGDDAVDWAWPATGKLIGGFIEGSNKGLDIAGKTGEPVLAAASGKVILVSSALRGYGNFAIIKHNASYLSVYAHNNRILVKEEQTVSKGQKIAEIGSSDSDQPKLHFEIRKQGKPVDPAKFLPVR